MENLIFTQGSCFDENGDFHTKVLAEDKDSFKNAHGDLHVKCPTTSFRIMLGTEQIGFCQATAIAPRKALTKLYLLPDHRRKGYGTKALELLGVEAVTCNKTDAATIAMLEATGSFTKTTEDMFTLTYTRK